MCFPIYAYDQVDFEVPIATEGDSYARYRCRMEEMHQSVRILQQCIDQLPPGPILSEDAPDLLMKPASRAAKAGEDGEAEKAKTPFPEGDFYSSTEVPKGELGFYFISDDSGKPYWMHVCLPSFIHISALKAMSEGGLIADLITNIGSIDIVLGESDR